jgi:hypothetical protein
MSYGEEVGIIKRDDQPRYALVMWLHLDDLIGEGELAYP